MSRQDYRVHVRVEFDIDLGSEHPANDAEVITKSVFENEFLRADAVLIDVVSVRLLKPSIR